MRQSLLDKAKDFQRGRGTYTVAGALVLLAIAVGAGLVELTPAQTQAVLVALNGAGLAALRRALPSAPQEESSA